MEAKKCEKINKKQTTKNHSEGELIKKRISFVTPRHLNLGIKRRLTLKMDAHRGRSSRVV